MNLKFIKDNNRGYFTISPVIINTNEKGETLDAEYWKLPSEGKSMTGELMQQDLECLNRHLNSAYKTLTYWDLYNISDSVDDAASLNAKINSLLPNSALVINAEEITNNDETYKRGDVILKLNNGTYKTIRAQSSGYYFPSQINTTESGANYLQFSYVSGVTPEEGTKELTNSLLEKPYKQIQIPLTLHDKAVVCYNIWSPITELTAPIEYKLVGETKVKVQPIIKTFISTNFPDNTSFEEVIMPITITDSTIEDKPYFTIVTPANLNNSLYILIK